MRAASDGGGPVDQGAPGPRRPAEEAPAPDDFTSHPAYRGALRLYGFVFDLETKFPDDEREMIYLALKRVSLEVGSFLAAGFGRERGEAGCELWEQARSRLMEARHYVLVAQSRYMLDALDVESFGAVYEEVLAGIEGLLADARRRA